MSEIAGPVRELIGATEQAAGNFGSDAEDMTQSLRAVRTVQDAAQRMVELFIPIAERSKEIMDALAPTVEGSSEIASSAAAHTQFIEEVLGAAATVLSGATNEHATNAVTHLRGATGQAVKAATGYSYADSSINGLAQRMTEVRNDIAKAAVSVASLKAEAEQVTAALELSGRESRGAASHSRQANAELEAYLGDIE